MEISEAFFKEIIYGFANRNILFSNEAQFQFDLAWEIRNELEASDSEVKFSLEEELEYKEYTDIVIHTGQTIIPIELKYKLAEKEYVYEVNNIQKRMHAQGAADNGCYDFCKDISRIEHIVNSGMAKYGYAIIITNYPLYWGDGVDEKSNWYPFCLEEGRTLSGKLEWLNGRTPTKERKEPINLNNSYELNWTDYKAIEEIGWYSNEGFVSRSIRSKSHPFKFLIVKIEKSM